VVQTKAELTAISADSVLDWLESAAVGLPSRTSRQANDQVFLGNEIDVVAWLAGRRIHGERTVRLDGNIHETVEGTRNMVWFDTIGLQGICEVAEATLVGLIVAVNDAECVLRTRCQKKIVSATRVLDDFEQDVASIGVDGIAFCQVELAGVVKSPAIRDGLLRIVLIEGNKIGHLHTLWIDDGESLTFLQHESRATSRLNLDNFRHRGGGWLNQDLCWWVTERLGFGGCREALRLVKSCLIIFSFLEAKMQADSRNGDGW
jgi:hypothetical protein